MAWVTYLLSIWVWMQILHETCWQGLYAVSISLLKHIWHKFSSFNAASSASLASSILSLRLEADPVCAPSPRASLMPIYAGFIFLHIISISVSASIFVQFSKTATSYWFFGPSSLRTYSLSLWKRVGSKEFMRLKSAVRLSQSDYLG